MYATDATDATDATIIAIKRIARRAGHKARHVDADGGVHVRTSCGLHLVVYTVRELRPWL
jgi:hypothetical protein